MANTDDLIREATRNGEDFLRTQMQVALAADQRAVSLGGVLAAAASVVLGFLFTDRSGLSEATSIASLLLSTGLGVSSALAFYSARPVRMRTLGNTPSNWYDDIERDKPFLEAMAEQLEHIDKGIGVNEQMIVRNARFLTAAMSVAAGSIVLAAVAGLAATVLS